VLLSNFTCLGRIARTTYVDAAYCYRPSSVVCRSVCLSTLVSPAKTTELIEMLVGLTTWVGPGNHVLDGSPDHPMESGNFEGKGRPGRLCGHLCKTADPIEMFYVHFSADAKRNASDRIMSDRQLRTVQDKYVDRIKHMEPFLANSRSRSLYAVARPSVVYLSSVCLSVCNARAPYSAG